VSRLRENFLARAAYTLENDARAKIRRAFRTLDALLQATGISDDAVKSKQSLTPLYSQRQQQ
jgi:hypothetical protein